MKKRTIYITLFLIFIIGVISLIGTFAIDSSITEGNSNKADYLFNITLGDRTNREIVIPSYDSKIVDIKISNPNEFNMAYLLYLEGVNSNISIINISDTDTSGVLNSKNTNLVKVFIQNNSGSDITTSIKDIVGFEKEKLSVPSNNTSINKGTYYKVIVKSNDNTYGKVKPNIKLSTSKGTVKYTISPNTGYQYKSNTCNGIVSNNILTISNITSNINCEVVFEPIEVTVSFDNDGGEISTTYTEAKEHTYTVPYSGTYKLEVWGAQGGDATYDTVTYNGGLGAYSTGNVYLEKNSMIYINVGGRGGGAIGSSATGFSDSNTGYNGGGYGCVTIGNSSHGGGGGATHIATISGLLKSLSNAIDNILIVSGGGGGASSHLSQPSYSGNGGNAGGIKGNDGKSANGTCYSYGLGGTQLLAGGHNTCSTDGHTYGNSSNTVFTNDSSFGLGGNYTKFTVGSASTSNFYTDAGGGGGYYGGGSAWHAAGGGGSGYIGNSQLTDKYMYCYNCSTSDDESTKTYTTTNVSSTPTADYAKSGNGAAKITLIGNASYGIRYGGKYSNLPTPTKTGYTFLGWYTEPNGQGTKITEDTILSNVNAHTLYANWQINTYTVTYDYRNNIYNQDTSTWILSGNNSHVDNTYSYNGTRALYLASSSLYTGAAIPLNGDKKQTTNYKLSIKAYRTIDFSGNLRAYAETLDSTGNVISWNHGISVNTSNLSLNTWKEYNYSFNTGAYSSWNYIYINYDTENQGPVYVSDIRLDEYTTGIVTYDTNYTNLPTPTRTGYTFEGWYTEENGTGTKITSESIVSTASDHTLYANWQPNTYYFDLNGYLDGTSLGNISGYGTADVYINGTLVCDDCTDYYAQHPYGTTYSITDIKATSGHKYNGIYSGSTSGTITGTTSVYLSFSQTSSIPTFTYTGSYQLVDDNNNTISNTSTWTGNWKIRFLSSGTFTSTSSIIVDIFAVGGGGGGDASGGCGGYTATKKTVKLQANTGYAITVGAGGAAGNAGGTSSFATFNSAAGGAGPGGSGGSGGGGSGYYLSSRNYINGGNGGSNGSNGVNGWGTDGYHNGYGQGTTTREFGESSGTLYSGGGGGSGHCGYDFVNAGSGGAGGGGNGGFAFTNGGNGTANTGGGGGGGCKSDGSGYQGGYGGSGIVIIRNTRF